MKAMKKFEMYVENFLFVIFFYSLVIFILTLDVPIKENQIVNNLIFINPLIITVGFLLSSFCVKFFPLWKFDDYFKEMTKEKIAKLLFQYKRNYFKLLMGFIFLIILTFFVKVIELDFVSHKVFYIISVIFLLWFILYFKFKYYKIMGKTTHINTELRIIKYETKKKSKIIYL